MIEFIIYSYSNCQTNDVGCLTLPFCDIFFFFAPSATFESPDIHASGFRFGPYEMKDK